MEGNQIQLPKGTFFPINKDNVTQKNGIL